MKHQVVLIAAVILLFGCSRGNPATSKAIGAEPAKEPVVTDASAEARTATVPAKESPVVSNAPSPKPNVSAAPSAATVPAPPPDSAQATVLALLDEQANKELGRKYLSPTTQLHAQYKSEGREEDWAGSVEENLRRHFLGKKFWNVEVAQIGCKTSICEILAVTRDKATAPAALRAWQVELFSLRREPWWHQAQMSDPTFQVSSTKDGRDFYVSYLTRKPSADATP
jgi:hypothetical protein